MYTRKFKSNYHQDKSWESLANPLLIRELEETFGGTIEQATLDDDQHHGTDYFWRRKEFEHRLAMRIRRAAFLKYKNDFTLREARPIGGNTTEIDKIAGDDWADLFVYGFSDGKKIIHWSLFNMSYFDPRKPFTYMPGYGPLDHADTITRIYRVDHQPKGFLVDVPAYVEQCARA